ncbi:hypothetical protein KJN74_02665 [Candidatus Bathyarchaeota archaeon]|nr:hypothetical protein [Candidatus Bathyarchaeota archaeon]
MPKTSKKKLFSLYKDPKVQLLISKFVSDELDVLNPTFDPNSGFSYPIIDEIVGDSSSAVEFLEKLFEGNVLERKLYEKIIYCPTCNSANISLNYTCPYCKSFDIKKSALIEHIKCGYIDTENHFKNENKLVCPKCNKDLISPDMDYNKAGVWCSCNLCDKTFDIPVPSHFCRECQTNFTFDDAIFKNIFSYSLTPEASKEATLGWIMIGPIMEFLEDVGLNVESPGFLKGKSGTLHMFDLTAVSANNDTTAIDLATFKEGVVSEQSVISMFAKIFDSKPEKACLVAIPKMSENGRKLAKLYKIKLIEAVDQNTALEALKDWFAE